jgi:hypothetical protein
MRKMTKNTSIILIATVAGIMIAGALAVAMPSAAFAETGCNGGIGKLGEPGGTAQSGGTNNNGGHNSQLANGGGTNGGSGGDANGADANGGNARQNGCNDSK